MTKNSQSTLAVIMARGNSQRMGSPKGLCRLPGQDSSFVSEITKIYNHKGLQILLVVQAKEKSIYQNDVQDSALHLLAESEGGDTALTLQLAMNWIENNQPNIKTILAHPVDLPLVKTDTITRLLNHFHGQSLAALRPTFNNQPGHPVIFSVSVLKSVLTGENSTSSMSHAWQKAEACSTVLPMDVLPVNDPGVCADFDAPSDLCCHQKPKDPSND